MKTEYEFVVFEDGEYYAGGVTKTLEEARNEVNHYMNGCDGELHCEIYEVTRKKVKY